jgi:hypothetical protein
VQARFLPGYDVSWPQAAAMRVGGDVVEIYAKGYEPPNTSSGTQNVLYLKVNGQLQGPPGRWHVVKDGSRRLSLPSGGAIVFEDFAGRYSGEFWNPRALTVVWPYGIGLDGYGVHLSTPYHEGYGDDGTFILAQLEIQLIRPDTYAGRERGMLGDNDGDPSNDFMRRNGEVLGQDAAMSWTALYGLFGGDWLVRPYECLFSDGCVTTPDFPTSAAVLTTEQRALGEAACAELSGYYREACVHDVGLSGSVELLQGFYTNTTDLNEMAALLQTPGVDLAVYALNRGARTELPESTSETPIYRQNASVTQVSGEGQFLLRMRPPRGASASFAAGYPGALGQYLTGEAELSTAVDVNCGQPDPQWNELLGEAWPNRGALQLWSIDPLSGFASQELGEIPLYCTSLTGQRLGLSGNASHILDQHGQIWSWGFGSVDGILGTEIPMNATFLVAADQSALSDAPVVSIAPGSGHMLALDADGRLWSWGSNNSGQLGIGVDSSEVTVQPTPVAVDLTNLDGAKVVAVDASNGWSVALDEFGRVWIWGKWVYFDGDVQEAVPPSQLDLSALEDARVVSLSAGGSHLLLLDETGQIWAMGNNRYGQLGIGSGPHELSYEYGLNLSIRALWAVTR